MRILAVSAAIVIACFLYPILPKAKDGLYAALRRLYAAATRLFTRKSGHIDDMPALVTFLLLLCGALLLLCVHPLVSALLMAPAFTGLRVLPGCAKAKDELDSGAYARDIPAYERVVRERCASLAPAFSKEVVAPMMLGCIGMPLHMGPALTIAYTALCALESDHPLAGRIAVRIQRVADRAFCAFLALCAGVVGRHPLRTKGENSTERLMSTLGIAGDSSDTHAPMSGDITQAIFLCFFSLAVLCFSLSAVAFVFCR